MVPGYFSAYLVLPWTEMVIRVFWNSYESFESIRSLNMIKIQCKILLLCYVFTKPGDIRSLCCVLEHSAYCLTMQQACCTSNIALSNCSAPVEQGLGLGRHAVALVYTANLHSTGKTDLSQLYLFSKGCSVTRLNTLILGTVLSAKTRWPLKCKNRYTRLVWAVKWNYSSILWKN